MYPLLQVKLLFVFLLNTVSSKTTAVIVGDAPGSKYDKARELGISIWTEEEFISKL